MLKDDRMMGMLTFVVILLALGTLIQRVDVAAFLFGSDAPQIELKADDAMVHATRTVSINVLANDTGVGLSDEERLTIVSSPACGRAFVRAGRIRYLGTHGCIGEQTLRYSLTGTGATAELRIDVRSPDESLVPKSGRPESEPPAAEAPEAEAEAVASRVAADGPEKPSRQPAEDDASDPADPPASSPATPGDAREPGAGPGAPDAGEGTMALARIEPDAQVGEADSAARDTPATRPGEAPRAGPAAEPTAREDDEADGAVAAVPARDGPEAPVEPREQPAPARPGEAADCTEPAAVTLDLEPAGMTRVQVDSPCHADGVAELAYDGLSFAVALDRDGAGSLAVPGFQGASDASLDLAGRAPMEFIIPFRDIERLERVAVVWQAPSELALHALEFGARPGGEGHVSPAEPRSFEAVRRAGGGWLTTYTPEQGRGQRIEVYSFWRRYGGPSGVVRLGLELGDVAGDAAGAGPQECAGGKAASADFKVLRMVGGRPAEPRLGRVAPLDCTALAAGPGRLIDEAVDDLIVRRR